MIKIIVAIWSNEPVLFCLKNSSGLSFTTFMLRVKPNSLETKLYAKTSHYDKKVNVLKNR